MKVYTLRTCHGQWAVCSDEGVLLTFESYDEAICMARSAVSVAKLEERKMIGARWAHPPHDRDTEDGRGGPGRAGVLGVNSRPAGEFLIKGFFNSDRTRQLP